MKCLLVALLLLAAGCQVHSHPDGKPLAPPSVGEFPAVCRMKNPQIAGSLIPLGNQRALTALHMYTQPVALIDGKLSGIDLEASGDAKDVSSSDWAIVRVNNTELPPPDKLVRDYQFRIGETVYIRGFVNVPGQASNSTPAPTLIEARVSTPPFWVECPKGVVLLQVKGTSDLSGASGGPVAIRGEVDGSWHTVGVYLGRWHSGIWTGYVVRPLPNEVFEPQPRH